MKTTAMPKTTAMIVAPLVLAGVLLARPAAADTDQPTTAEVLFSKQVQDRKPVAPNTTFSPGKLYCWTKLSSDEREYLIAHHWIRNGRRVWRQPIQVHGRRWVTWSHFNVTPGSWTVKVTDGSGMPMGSASFTVE